MTRITDNTKEAVVRRYSLMHWSISDIARWYEISRRSVGRILDEAGIERKQSHRQRTAEEMLQVANKYGLRSAEQLEQALSHMFKGAKTYA